MTNRFKWETRGNALSENMIKGDRYRFTILTPRMIRMEFDPIGEFEDRATQSIFYRDFPMCEYTVKRSNGELIIETEGLCLRYVENQPFEARTLQVCLKQFPGATWKFGETAEQLKGTARTLDRTNGEIPLEDGVCSRNGYTVIDDSTRMVLTDDGWFDIRREGISDIYFLGYGHDYLDCLKDFYRLTGKPPLLPDYALGNWWSRYHAYTQREYSELIERFERENIPFSVAVVDMDWHTVKGRAPENEIKDKRYSAGWTGYTWNTELFPDYKEFLRFLKAHHLKTALNLHPAQGVGCDESMYAEMATAVGMDPASKKPVKFDCLNPAFMESYFDILHHPYEEDGVDFWWMDWQQGTDYWWVHDEDHQESPLEQMDPLWLLNHLHVLDISRDGKRPMFFSRYSGIGAHRYPVGFSGDTHITWKSLDFQPYFTANASNVGYGWWSHDIGGHMHGYRDDELSVRWLQLGVFSPINRLHSSNEVFTGKEPWNLHPYMASVAKRWLQLRHRLFPYLYTMNYRHSTELIPLVLPMYYSHPEKEAAYRYRNQYWFGSELMVNPITEKNDPCTFLGKTKVWFPEGTWIDAFNGTVYKGDREMAVYRGLEQMPVFARAGAIIPMEEYSGDNRLGRKKDMELFVFSGADNVFTLYEDGGDYDEYRDGVFAKTTIELKWGKQPAIRIGSVMGDSSILPQKRNWTIKLRGFRRPEAAELVVDGEVMPAEFEYDADTATVVFRLSEISVCSDVQIKLFGEGDLLYGNENTIEKVRDILMHAQMGYGTKMAIWNLILQKKYEKVSSVCAESGQEALLGALEEWLGSCC